MMGKFLSLTDEDLERIFQKYVKDGHRISCDEHHSHSFDCVNFDDERTMILERLRVEVKLQREKLKQISSLSQQ